MKLTKLFMILAVGGAMASCSNGDDEAPMISFVSPQDSVAVSAGASFTLEANVTDNEGLASIVVSDGNSTLTSITEFDSETEHKVNAEVAVNADSQPGNLTITITAKDAEGNEGTESRTVRVQ